MSVCLSATEHLVPDDFAAQMAAQLTVDVSNRGLLGYDAV
jgi:hypothetical protein